MYSLLGQRLLGEEEEGSERGHKINTILGKRWGGGRRGRPGRGALRPKAKQNRLAEENRAREKSERGGAAESEGSKTSGSACASYSSESGVARNGSWRCHIGNV